MKIAVSACLLGENCKYNGGNNYNEKVMEFVKGHEVIGVCPELLGGLPVPREPAEIADGIVRTKDGASVNEEFRLGAEAAMNIIEENHIELVILQSRSPSCGVKAIYDGTFSHTTVKGDGFACELLKKKGIKVYSELEKIDF